MTGDVGLQGGVTVIVARAVFVGALLSVGGVLTFRTMVLPRVEARMQASAMAGSRQALSRLTWVALLVTLLAGILWTVLEAASLAGADRVQSALAALRPVLLSTQFGHLVSIQAALVGMTALLVWTDRPRTGACLAMANVALHAAHGHAMAMGGPFSILFWVSVLHLLAAAGWTGGLLPLLLVIRHAPSQAGALAARWFSPLGQWCVVVLAASATLQALRLVATWSAMFDTPYGWMVLVKTACFGGLFILAVVNRYRLAPALLADRRKSARSTIVGSIAVQTGIGLLAVVASAFLSALPPGMDMGAG